MATKVETRSAHLYEADFYVWAEEQVALLRAASVRSAEFGQTARESRTKRSAALNNAWVIVEHLLKLEHSPAT